MKVLTVTIPSYNVEKFLDKTLSSFVNEEIIDKIEVLIVNDGSKDNTANIAKTFENKYPNSFRLVDKENGGHGSTINRGILEAKGKYFKVVDGDDWVDTAAFCEFVQRLENTDTDVVMTPHNTVSDATGEFIKFYDVLVSGFEYNREYNFADYIKRVGDNYQMHSTTFKTQILKNSRKIAEKCFYVDQEYINFPLDKVSTVMLFDTCIYQYRIGNVSQSMNLKNMQKNREMHKRVVFDIISFYNEIENSTNANIKEFLAGRIVGLITTQINIYMSMKLSGAVADECSEFLKEINKVCPILYARLGGTTAKLLKTNTKLGYALARLKHKLFS